MTHRLSLALTRRKLNVERRKVDLKYTFSAQHRWCFSCFRFFSTLRKWTAVHILVLAHIVVVERDWSITWPRLHVRDIVSTVVAQKIGFRQLRARGVTEICLSLLVGGLPFRCQKANNSEPGASMSESSGVKLWLRWKEAPLLEPFF